LHDRPDDGQTTGFGGKSINLIGALPNVTKQTFNRIGAANRAMHDWREGVNEVGSQRVASPIDPEERFSKVVTL
jgi:hypothetical protein